MATAVGIDLGLPDGNLQVCGIHRQVLTLSNYTSEGKSAGQYSVGVIDLVSGCTPHEFAPFESKSLGWTFTPGLKPSLVVQALRANYHLKKLVPNA